MRSRLTMVMISAALALAHAGSRAGHLLPARGVRGRQRPGRRDHPRLHPAGIQRPRVVGVRRAGPLGSVRGRGIPRPLRDSEPGQVSIAGPNGLQQPYLVGAPHRVSGAIPGRGDASARARLRLPQATERASVRGSGASVRAVVGPPEQRCWVERQQVVESASSAPNVPGALVGAIIGGVLGHQVGGGRGQDVATAGGAVAGAAIGANVGRSPGGMYTQDVQRCATVPGSARPDFWDVMYYFDGLEHHMQLNGPPPPTIWVNRNGEPRM